MTNEEPSTIEYFLVLAMIMLALISVMPWRP
jgi:hypothetical protein